MEHAYQDQLFTAYKQSIKVKDIKVLMNCGDTTACDLHKKIKLALGESYIYPIPTDIALEILGIDLKKLEKAALLEFKLKKDVTNASKAE